MTDPIPDEVLRDAIKAHDTDQACLSMMACCDVAASMGTDAMCELLALRAAVGEIKLSRFELEGQEPAWVVTVNHEAVRAAQALLPKED
jgi:hypothetical protein